MKNNSFDNKENWEARYKDTENLGVPGTFTHTHYGNISFYLTKYKALDRVLSFLETSLEGKDVLDAAGGTGQFVHYYLMQGARHVHLTDFAQNALDIVNQEYGEYEQVSTELYDLSMPKSNWLRSFDFILVMEAIFLLPTDEAAVVALQSLASGLKQGGYIIISDVFPKQTIVDMYVRRRSKLFFEQTLIDAGLEIRGYVPQTFIFNRKIFGRLQRPIEKYSGKFLYYIDQLALSLGLTPPPDSWADIKYLVAQKTSLFR